MPTGTQERRKLAIGTFPLLSARGRLRSPCRCVRPQDCREQHRHRPDSGGLEERHFQHLEQNADCFWQKTPASHSTYCVCAAICAHGVAVSQDQQFAVRCLEVQEPSEKKAVGSGRSGFFRRLPLACGLVDRPPAQPARLGLGQTSARVLAQTLAEEGHGKAAQLPGHCSAEAEQLHARASGTAAGQGRAASGCAGGTFSRSFRSVGLHCAYCGWALIGFPVSPMSRF